MKFLRSCSQTASAFLKLIIALKTVEFIVPLRLGDL